MGIIELGAVFWITAVITIILAGISKGGFGSGPAAIATPLLSLVMPVAEAAALLLPILLIADAFTIHQYRNDVDRPNLKALLPGAMIGVVLGSLVFYQFVGNERVLKFGIGVIAVSFVLYQLLRNRLAQSLTKRTPSVFMGWIMGAIAGFVSTLAHVGGPIVVMYLLPQRLPRHLFIGTAAVFFFIVNTVKLIPYTILDLFAVGNLWITLLLLPVAYIGVRVGVWLNNRFTDKWFNRVMYSVLLIVGIQLILGKSFVGLIFG